MLGDMGLADFQHLWKTVWSFPSIISVFARMLLTACFAVLIIDEDLPDEVRMSIKVPLDSFIGC